MRNWTASEVISGVPVPASCLNRTICFRLTYALVERLIQAAQERISTLQEEMAETLGEQYF
ncbi:hypothetical protein CC235_24650 [Salmonella enterica subsp. enterica serovar Kentucky]|uniref:Uncharacterized protein n=2 Tax=Salmonella enterica TaxID=28901 RepID=A0A5Z2PQ05_SALER|nr:hypothetical protein [Escherichia fergusonii]EAO1554898.1 hypothetical protein [Salmonella enterica]EAO5518886.1 hypothetical protein [Salmonella enterica subsp. enterica serovar Kentucky]EBT1943601.1 hypothetical protein [Salmonella enterica subsp. enterica]EDK7601114.1 hypothetical protein [Salmonella enterica subsp. enterica serovar Typhimurium]EDQ8702309.1 hypothetical protein [Salmonella enterica subsp. enterica serovar Johannesburg]EEE2990554.1 hypothetical protein [Salmonella enteri